MSLSQRVFDLSHKIFDYARRQVQVDEIFLYKKTPPQSSFKTKKYTLMSTILCHLINFCNLVLGFLFNCQL